MNKNANPWDELGKKTFNTHRSDEIDPQAADNILIAWPSLLKLITREFPNSKNISVLDFGCGTGAFCTKLDQMGYKVTGIDPSREMVKIARANSSKSIKYILGDKAKLPKNKFQIITSIMTLPFIEDIGDTIETLVNHLNTGGIFVFADFNKEWVKECLKKRVSFSDFDSLEDPNKGLKTFGDIKVPVYIRKSEEYERIARNNNLSKILEEYPPFTQNFIDSYPDKRPKNISEYMILGYKKN